MVYRECVPCEKDGIIHNPGNSNATSADLLNKTVSAECPNKTDRQTFEILTQTTAEKCQTLCQHYERLIHNCSMTDKVSVNRSTANRPNC